MTSDAADREESPSVGRTLADIAEDESVIVRACPDCESRHIERVTRDPDVTHRCGDCGHRFDDPIERERRHTKPPDQGTMAGALHAMEPDELGGGA